MASNFMLGSPNVIPVTNPASAATNLSPSSFQIATTTTGVVGTFFASGGTPDGPYTYTLSGADASHFTIGLDTGIFSVPIALSARTYSFTVNTVNTNTLTKNFARTVLSVAPAEVVFSTPAIPSWNSMTLTSVDASTFTIASSTVVGFPASGTHRTLQSLLDAVPDQTIITLPAGDFFGGLHVSRYSICLLGQVDGSNNPTTCLSMNPLSLASGGPDPRGSTSKNCYNHGIAGVSGTIYSLDTSTPDAVCYLFNITLGITDTQKGINPAFQFGYKIFSFGDGCRINIVNCIMRNAASDGVSSDVTNEWYTRQNNEVWIYDSEIYACGSTSLEHNLYLHSQANVVFIRSISRDAIGGGGLLKVDGEKIIAIDSDLDKDSGTFSTNKTKSKQYTIPAAAPYTVSIAGLLSDNGVNYSAPFTPLAKVGSSPTIGQYSISGTTYTFAAADAGKKVEIFWNILFDPGNNAPCSFSRDMDVRVDTLYIHAKTPTNVDVFGLQARANAGGGFGLKFPSYVNNENNSGGLRDSAKLFMPWASGNPGYTSGAVIFGNSIHYLGLMQTSALATDTSITVKNIGYDGPDSPFIDLSTGTTYTVRILCNDGSRFEFTGNPTAAPVSGIQGTASFNLGGQLGGGGASTALGRVAIKRSIDSWDTPILNPVMYNQASKDSFGNANYYWRDGYIKTGGVLDITKTDNFYSAFIQNVYCLYDAGNASNFIQPESQGPEGYWRHNTTKDEVPSPPCNNPQGETAAWPNVAGAAVWTSPIQTDSFPSRGINPTGYTVNGSGVASGTDAVWASPCLVANIGLDKISVTNLKCFGPEMLNSPDYPESAGLRPDCRVLGPVSVAQVTTSNMTDLPLPTGKTTVSGTQTAGATSLTVASIAGIIDGQRLMVLYDRARGRQRFHNTTVNGTPSGNTVNITDALLYDVSSGNRLITFTKSSSSPPAWWITRDEYAFG